MKKLLNYLSFRGRANRVRFWLTAIAIDAILFVSSVAAVGLSGVSPFFSVLFLPAFIVAIVAGIANSARRLHDRRKSAWWLLLFSAVPSILFLPAEAAKTSSDPGAAGLAALCGLLGLPFAIWGFVEIGCLRGTVGPNKYGEDPLTPAQEAIA